MWDILEANRKGFGQSTTPILNGKIYVWHHFDDYDPIRGFGTMQLVRQDAHKGIGHIGGVSQYKKATGNSYVFKTW